MEKHTYKLTTSAVAIYRFRAEGAPYWADIIIDSPPGAKHGRIYIASDFGSWNYYWGSCGSPFRQFLAGCDQHYVAKNFGANKFFDPQLTIAAMEKQAEDLYTKKSAQYRNMMECINTMERSCSSKDDFMYYLQGECKPVMRMYDSGPEFVYTLDPGFKNFWEQIWPLLMAEFKSEEVTPEETTKDQARHIGITQGVAVAVNYLLRGDTAEGIWNSAGMTIRECIAKKVDTFDLDRLIPEFANTEDAEAIAGYYSQLDDEEHAEQRTNALEFLHDLNDALREKAELEASLTDSANKEDIRQKIEWKDEFISDSKEAYIDIVKERD